MRYEQHSLGPKDAENALREDGAPDVRIERRQGVVQDIQVCRSQEARRAAAAGSARTSIGVERARDGDALLLSTAQCDALLPARSKSEAAVQSRGEVNAPDLGFVAILQDGNVRVQTRSSNGGVVACLVVRPAYQPTSGESAHSMS